MGGTKGGRGSTPTAHALRMHSVAAETGGQEGQPPPHLRRRGGIAPHLSSTVTSHTDCTRTQATKRGTYILTKLRYAHASAPVEILLATRFARWLFKGGA